MAELGPYLDYNGEEYECLLCQRYFASIASLYQHCKDTNYHEWCEGCRRVFVSLDAKRAHLRTSCTPRAILYTPPSSPHLPARRPKPKHHCMQTVYRCDDCGKAIGNENNLRMVSPFLFLPLEFATYRHSKRQSGS